MAPAASMALVSGALLTRRMLALHYGSTGRVEDPQLLALAVGGDVVGNDDWSWELLPGGGGVALD